MNDPLRPQKERILDQIIQTGLRRKDKEIEYLRASGQAKDKAMGELLALHAEEDQLVDQFNGLANPQNKGR